MKTNSVLVEVQDLRTCFPIKAGIFQWMAAGLMAIDSVNLWIRKDDTPGTVWH